LAGALSVARQSPSTDRGLAGQATGFPLLQGQRHQRLPARLVTPSSESLGTSVGVATRDPLARLAGVPFLPLRYFPQQFTSPDLRAYADVSVAYDHPAVAGAA
jgi:hypothetical protein